MCCWKQRSSVESRRKIQRNRFLPATGTVLALQEPSGPGIRVESSLYPGLQVPLFYDTPPLEAGCWGRDRHTGQKVEYDVPLAEYQVCWSAYNLAPLPAG